MMIKFNKEPVLYTHEKNYDNDDYEKKYIIKYLKPLLEQNKMYEARRAFRSESFEGNEYLDIICFLVYHLQDDYFRGNNNILSYEFAGIEEITAIAIPNWITTICEGAFIHCENLKNITVPTSVSSIEEEAFHNTALKRVVVPKSCDIASNAFDDNVEIIRR